MKTKITIEIESKFTPVYKLDEDGEIDEKEEVTQELEKGFHNAIDSCIRGFIEDSLEDSVFDYDLEYMVEGRDCFNEYGTMTFNIKTEEMPEEKEAEEK